jgi:hypothetical protein
MKGRGAESREQGRRRIQERRGSTIEGCREKEQAAIG